MVRGLLVFVALVASVAVCAQDFEEGVHYARLPIAVTTGDPAKVEVVEVFSYACIHCKNFDPDLEAWRVVQPESVEFRRVPAVFNQTWATLAQAFYTAEALEVGAQVHASMFHAIHDRGVDLRRPELLAALFQEMAGVEPEKFHEMFDSFAVRGRIQQADAQGRAYRVSGVPAIIVDGQYRVDARMAGDNERMLAVVDFLVAQQSNAKGIDVLPVAPSIETSE
jgi:thiol:disulfide interchange protein DsbA